MFAIVGAVQLSQPSSRLVHPLGDIHVRGGMKNMYIRKNLQEIYIQKYEAYTNMMKINMYIRKNLQEIYIQKYEAYTNMMKINRLVR